MSSYKLKKAIMPSFDQDYFYDVVVSSDEKYVALTSSQRKVKLYRYPSLNFEGELSGHSDRVQNLKFFNNGSCLLTCSADGSIKMWDLRKGFTAVDTAKLEFGELFGIDVHKDNNLFAVSGETGDVAVGDIRKGLKQFSHQFSGLHTDIARKVLFCDSNQLPANIFEDGEPAPSNAAVKPYLFSCSDDGCVNVFDLMSSSDDDALIHVINVGTGLDKFGFVSSNKTNYNLMYTITHTHAMSLWDIKEASSVGSACREGVGAEYFIDAKFIASQEALYNFSGVANGDILVSKFVVNGSEASLQKHAMLTSGHSSFVRGVWTSANMDTIITTGEDSRVCMWTTAQLEAPSSAPATTTKSPLRNERHSPY